MIDVKNETTTFLKIKGNNYSAIYSRMWVQGKMSADKQQIISTDDLCSNHFQLWLKRINAN